MSDQTQPTPAPVAPQQVPVTVIEVTEGPSLTQRVRTYSKLAFDKVGVPVLVGSAAAFVATRATRSNNEDEDAVNDDSSTDNES